jgi:hypothetical protein
MQQFVCTAALLDGVPEFSSDAMLVHKSMHVMQVDMPALGLQGKAQNALLRVSSLPHRPSRNVVHQNRRLALGPATWPFTLLLHAHRLPVRFKAAAPPPCLHLSLIHFHLHLLPYRLHPHHTSPPHLPPPIKTCPPSRPLSHPVSRTPVVYPRHRKTLMPYLCS